jgi:hypothetical protein
MATVIQTTQAIELDVMLEMAAKFDGIGKLSKDDQVAMLSTLQTDRDAVVKARLEAQRSKVDAERKVKENAESAMRIGVSKAFTQAWESTPALDKELIKLATADESIKRLTYYIPIERTSEGEGDAKVTSIVLGVGVVTLASKTVKGTGAGGNGKGQPLTVVIGGNAPTTYPSAAKAKVLLANPGDNMSRAAIISAINALDGHEVAGT